MKKKLWGIVSSTLLMIIIAKQGFSLDGKHIVQMKRAGVSDQTIQLIIKEKVIEPAAFSVQDIVEMKKAGLGEKALQMLINESTFLKNKAPIVYGKDIKSTRFTTAQDVIELKKAGLSDEVIQAIVAVCGERYYSEREEALDFLKNMNIRVNLRDVD